MKNMKKIKYLFTKSIKRLMGINEESAAILSYAQMMYYSLRNKERREILGGEKYKLSTNLNIHEFQVFSQSGQDGIIAEIFRRIGLKNKQFVEFGVGAGGGMQNNSMYLINKSYSSSASNFALCAGSKPEIKAFFSIKSITAFFLLILSSLRSYSIISLNSSQVLIKARNSEALLF